VRLVHGRRNVGFLSKEKVSLLVNVKNRVEQVVPGIYADLLIASPKEPNAFAAIHDGVPVVAITLGMLDLVGWDRDAYAAIIGHEYAHLALHHGAARSQREGVSHAASEALGLILSRAGVPMGRTVATLGVTAIERTYTRDEERDADRGGLEYMVKAGFDVEGAVRLWEKMRRVPSGFSVPFLATHPMTEERVANMKTLVVLYAKREEPVSSSVTAPQQTGPPSPSSTPVAVPTAAGEGDAPLLDTRRIAVGRRVRISMEPLALYKEPSRDSERVERLSKTDDLFVEEISSEWLRVRSSTGSRGWVMKIWIDAQ
jgi:hypothetical protein